jgi:hypothetical protein
MALVFKNPDLQNPLSLNVAGPSLIFLAASIPLYWIIIALYENKAFRCRCRGNNQSQAGASQNDLRETLVNNMDEDVLEEERRVSSHDPQGLTVMVDQV